MELCPEPRWKKPEQHPVQVQDEPGRVQDVDRPKDLCRNLRLERGHVPRVCQVKLWADQLLDPATCEIKDRHDLQRAIARMAQAVALEHPQDRRPLHVPHKVAPLQVSVYCPLVESHQRDVVHRATIRCGFWGCEHRTDILGHLAGVRQHGVRRNAVGRRVELRGQLDDQRVQVPLWGLLKQNPQPLSRRPHVPLVAAQRTHQRKLAKEAPVKAALRLPFSKQPRKAPLELDHVLLLSLADQRLWQRRAASLRAEGAAIGGHPGRPALVRAEPCSLDPK
mmetsp:Transcript_6616/g.21135  ORF Transcript_6616/g.21135 Transcript_6616/m.21135 type:complete len:279 (+) Transcript_6616:702-1538(+)